MSTPELYKPELISPEDMPGDETISMLDGSETAEGERLLPRTSDNVLTGFVDSVRQQALTPDQAAHYYKMVNPDSDLDAQWFSDNKNSYFENR